MLNSRQNTSPDGHHHGPVVQRLVCGEASFEVKGTRTVMNY